MDKWNEFFTLYNEGLAIAYDKAMERIVDEAQTREPDFQEHLRNEVLNSMQAWYKKPFESLGGATPEQMIDGIGTIEEAISRIRLAAAFCDDDIPEYLKIKLGSFGEQAVEHLVQVAMAPSWEGDYVTEAPPSAEILGAVIALRILGEWQVKGPIGAIVDKFVATGTPHELIADAFKFYISGIGEETVPTLVEALMAAGRKDSLLTGPYEYVLIALTLASQERKTDEAFACLRASFRAMQHKVIGAICLGDYGDPKAISVLKGHLDRNAGKFDRQEFYEILSSIKRLGGSIQDVHDPFRDFSAR